MSNDENTWLPNLVGGVSLWKLAPDLNEPQLFDGRLLQPETEGSDSLPTVVRWDVSDLIPFSDAQVSHPDECAAAVADFQACLAKVGKSFADPDSGYHKYKDALTVPSLDAGAAGATGTANYFFDPRSKRLRVTNWGASPRVFGAKNEYVFGFGEWGALFGAAAGGIAAVAAASATPATPTSSAATPDEEEKKPEENAERKPFPWKYVGGGLAFLVLLALALFLLRACPALNHDKEGAVDGSASDSASDTASLQDTSTLDAPNDADSATDAQIDAADAGDASHDGATDAYFDEEDDEDIQGSSGGTGSGGGASSSGGAGSSGGKVKVEIGPGGGGKAGPHRVHIAEGATEWRVVASKDKVSRAETKGGRYTLWLKPGSTFEGVKVEWKDQAGKWHPH